MNWNSVTRRFDPASVIWSPNSSAPGLNSGSAVRLMVLS
jgi:hypothetical protein